MWKHPKCSFLQLQVFLLDDTKKVKGTGTDSIAAGGLNVLIS